MPSARRPNPTDPGDAADLSEPQGNLRTKNCRLDFGFGFDATDAKRALQ